MQVPHRRIGTDGPEVSVLSLGSWHTYDRMHFEDAVALISEAVERGINLFDVGVYGTPEMPPAFTDVLFARIVQAAGIDRSRYVLSSKLWLEGYPQHSFSDQLDRALFRVGTDRADVAILGDVRDPDLDMRRLVLDLAELVRDGRLGAWGVNNWSAQHLRAAHDAAAAEGVPTPQMTQWKYSVCRRAVPDSDDFRRMLADTGITLQASDVLEGGILAGKLQPTRQIGRDPGDIRSAVRDAAVRLAEIAKAMDTTPAQLGIAFCLTHPSATTVLFGATRREQLAENIGALELVEREGADLVRAAVHDLWLDR